METSPPGPSPDDQPQPESEPSSEEVKSAIATLDSEFARAEADYKSRRELLVRLLNAEEPENRAQQLSLVRELISRSGQTP